MKISTWKKKFSKFLVGILVLGLILSCINTKSVQAASQNSTYYYCTILNKSKGGKTGNYWIPGTRQVNYTNTSITFYGSFSKSKKLPVQFSKNNFIKYGKKTFKLTSKTKYYWTEEYRKIPAKKTDALKCCKRLNGLQVVLQIKGSNVVSLTFYS